MEGSQKVVEVVRVRHDKLVVGRASVVNNFFKWLKLTGFVFVQVNCPPVLL